MTAEILTIHGPIAKLFAEQLLHGSPKDCEHLPKNLKQFSRLGPELAKLGALRDLLRRVLQRLARHDGIFGGEV